MFVRRRKWIATIFALVLTGCALTQLFLSWARRPIPSRAELCQALSEYIEESECRAQPSVSTLVHEAFSPGITTREEVHRSIGQYLAAEHDGLEFYHLSGTWFTRNLDFPEPNYIFSYDEDDRLLTIGFED